MKTLKTISRWIAWSFCIILFAFSHFGCHSSFMRPSPNPKRYFTDPDVLALVKAAKKGDIETIDRLVAEGVDVNTKGKDDATPLIFALIARNEAGFQRLLEHGADPNIQLTAWMEKTYPSISAGNSPMSVSAGTEESSEFLKLCLKHGGNLDVMKPYIFPDHYPGGGETPLFNAVSVHCNKNLENTKILIKAGANLNHQAQNGQTPAMAAIPDFYAAVYELLKAGADWRLKSNSGRNLASYCFLYPVRKTPTNKRSKQNMYYRKKVLDFLREKGVDLEAARKYKPKPPK